jgi:hypothetical protein
MRPQNRESREGWERWGEWLQGWRVGEAAVGPAYTRARRWLHAVWIPPASTRGSHPVTACQHPWDHPERALAEALPGTREAGSLDARSHNGGWTRREDFLLDHPSCRSRLGPSRSVAEGVKGAGQRSRQPRFQGNDGIHGSNGIEPMVLVAGVPLSLTLPGPLDRIIDTRRKMGLWGSVLSIAASMPPYEAHGKPLPFTGAQSSEGCKRGRQRRNL